MELMLPSTKFKESFIKAVEEYHAVHSDDRRDIYKLKIKELQSDFPAYISKLLSKSEGKNLPEGYVPQTTYWLVDNDEFIGRVDIRRSLTEHLLKEGGHIGYDIRPSKRKLGYGKKLLELSLPKAKKLGITKVLITCDETNSASKRIIESNGGILENRIKFHKGKSPKLRYWIPL